MATDPQIVGNAFVQQYYYILHNYPEKACNFYQDASVLTRPGPDGVMTLVTTLKAINDKILSSDNQNYKAEIYSADSQLLNGGVIVLVNGCLTGNNNVSRKFTQVFSLVPQNGSSSYYVLNDIFRYVNNDADEKRVVTLTTPPLTNQNPDHTTNTNDDKEDTKTASSKIQEGNDAKEVIKTTSSKIQEVNDAKEVTKIASSTMQEDTPKKTYASLVHALMENTAPFVVRVPPPKPKEQPCEATTAPKTTSAPSSAAPKTTSPGHSIFVANLPMDATVGLLVGIFKQFGAIKPNGVRVRSHIEGNCFGFVEFEHASSVEGALQASPIIIGNQKARIARKRENNDSGRFPPVHNRRNEFERQAEGQVRGNAGYNGKGKGRAAGQGQGGRK